jgi:tripartite-type tricarboxylate transporter receptor subunit TctC
MTVAPDAFPARPITLIVPFPAGGPSDALARAIAQGMSIHLKQPIVIENISGAGGTIGLAKLVKSAPDGYTLGFGTVGTHVANAALYKKLPYDPLADFDAVGLAGTAPTILLARPLLPASNLPEFVAYAGANRATATYGSAGVGSISHFACVILLSALKQNVTHVPYRGVAPAMNDLMGGHIDVMCDQSTTSLPQVAGGKVKALAVLTDRKLAQLPDVATASSFGYGDVNIRVERAVRAQGHVRPRHQAAQRRAAGGGGRRRFATPDGGGGGRPARSRATGAPHGVRADRDRARARCPGAAGARRIP